MKALIIGDYYALLMMQLYNLVVGKRRCRPKAMKKIF